MNKESLINRINLLAIKLQIENYIQRVLEIVVEKKQPVVKISARDLMILAREGKNNTSRTHS